MKRKPSENTVAVGLSYDDGQSGAPELTVKGEEYLADQIKKIADRFGVPVVEDPQLAEVLLRREVGSEIPEELYEAVAIVLRNLENNQQHEEKQTQGRHSLRRTQPS